MILFKTIRWKNFYATGNEFIEIPLSRHRSALFQGKNGSGKSTMIDALCFALYKKPFRNVTLPQMVNTITNKNLLVEVEFEHKGTEYMIRRGYKPACFEIFENGHLLDQSSKEADDQEFLDRILGMNYKSFCQIVVLGFANYTPFMKLKTPERRAVVEDLLDYQIFSVMNSVRKEKTKDIENQLDDVTHRIEGVDARIELNRQHLELAKADDDKVIAQKQTQLDALGLTVSNLSQEIIELKNQSSNWLESITDEDVMRSKLAKAHDISRDMQGKHNTCQADILFFSENDNCPTCRQSITEEFRNNMIETKKNRMIELEMAEDKLGKKIEPWVDRLLQIDKVKKSISDIGNKITRLTAELKTHLLHRKTLQSEIDDLSKKEQTEVKDIRVMLQLEKNQLLSDKERLEADATLFDNAAMLLADSGIKARLIRNFIPLMNELVNKYLEQLEFFGHFLMDENFDAIIRARHRDELSYDGLSQGQKLRIDLAILFTWRQLAKMRSNTSTNILIFDEICDSSLDDQGIEDLMGILNNMTEGHNIFIISHKGDNIADKFDHIYQFALSHGHTEIKEAA